MLLRLSITQVFAFLESSLPKMRILQTMYISVSLKMYVLGGDNETIAEAQTDVKKRKPRAFFRYLLFVTLLKCYISKNIGEENFRLIK